VAKGAGSTERGPELNALLRALPSVDELAARLEGVPHARAVAAARAVIDARRLRSPPAPPPPKTSRTKPASGWPVPTKPACAAW